MLPKFSLSEPLTPPVICKEWAGRDVSALGAFPQGAVLTLTALVPRKLAVGAVVMRLSRDTAAVGEEGLDASPRDLPFSFVSTDGRTDIYRLTLDTAAICEGGAPALFYYEYIFPRGMDTLFSDSTDNVNYTLTHHSARQFRLLTYDPAFRTPEHFGGGVMYHVFVDRFARGAGETSYRPDAELHSEWDGEEPRYAATRGGDVKNNDYFGGNLWGVAEKLPYLRSLGVTVLYLSPIFEAASNHKYDTSDYSRVDPAFGGDGALRALLDAAHANGMRVVLDGVFNHTGNDSVYFDAFGKYGGAAVNPASPYRQWFYFTKNEDGTEDYASWWGIRILPKLNLREPSCREYLVGEGGIVDRYTAAGVDGWRLDVADELPDEFLDELRATVHRRNPQAFIVGEVWENAADKISYSRRRRYFRGGQLDSVMNYPLRTALIAYAQTGSSAPLAAVLTELWSSYPPPVCAVLMNLIGTHDTERILTFLGDPEGTLAMQAVRENRTLSESRLSAAQRRRGRALLRVVSAIQFTVFGFPCVYYGDETGAEGLGDPFCRRPMNWTAPDEELLAHYRRLGAIRAEHSAFDGGDFRLTRAEGGYIEYVRENETEKITVAANLGEKSVHTSLPGAGTELLSGRRTRGSIRVPPCGVVIVKED